MPEVSQRVDRTELVRTVRTAMQVGPATARPRGTMVEPHCTVQHARREEPFEDSPQYETILHVFDDGQFLVSTETDLIEIAPGNFQPTLFSYRRYSGGMGLNDPLVRSNIISTGPILRGFQHYVRIDNDTNIFFHQPFVSNAAPLEVRAAVLEVSPTTVVQAPSELLLTIPPVVGVRFPVYPLQLTANKVLLYQWQWPATESLKTWVLTVSPGNLVVGPEQLHVTGFGGFQWAGDQMVRINDTTALLVASDLEEDRSHNGGTEYMVKGIKITVSGDNVTLAAPFDMHWSMAGNARVQMAPTPAGPVVIAATASEPLPGNNKAHTVWAVNPLTQEVGPRTLMDVEIIEQGYMQPTGNRQVASVVLGIDPYGWGQDGTNDDDAMMGMVVNVRSDLSVEAYHNTFQPEISWSDFQDSGWGTANFHDNWQDWSRGRPRLIAETSSGVNQDGGISHYIVTGGISHAPSTVVGIQQQVRPRGE